MCNIADRTVSFSQPTLKKKNLKKKKKTGLREYSFSDELTPEAPPFIWSATSSHLPSRPSEHPLRALRGGRAEVGRGRAIRRAPPWGRRGVCHGSAAPARGSPARAPGPPPWCWCSASRWSSRPSGWRRPLLQRQSLTPRWP